MSYVQDPYTYPGSNVLKNLGGYTDQCLLDVFEADVVALALVELQETPITQSF